MKNTIRVKPFNSTSVANLKSEKMDQELKEEIRLMNPVEKLELAGRLERWAEQLRKNVFKLPAKPFQRLALN